MTSLACTTTFVETAVVTLTQVARIPPLATTMQTLDAMTDLA
jgi:hypothetical protein